MIRNIEQAPKRTLDIIHYVDFRSSDAKIPHCENGKGAEHLAASHWSEKRGGANVTKYNIAIIVALLNL